MKLDYSRIINLSMKSKNKAPEWLLLSHLSRVINISNCSIRKKKTKKTSLSIFEEILLIHSATICKPLKTISRC